MVTNHDTTVLLVNWTKGRSMDLNLSVNNRSERKGELDSETDRADRILYT